MAGGLLVHGVVRADAPPPEPSTTLVTWQETAALCTALPPGEEAATPGAMRAHARLLEAALEAGPVAPIRFGEVVEDADAVVDRLLHPHAERLGVLLERLTGRVQLTLRASCREEALLRDVAAGDQEVARLRAGLRGRDPNATYYARIRLGELVAAGFARRRDALGRFVLLELEPLAVATVERERRGDDVALDAAFLVDRERVDEFAGAADRLAEQELARVRLRLLGPAPAYDFVDLRLEEAAWA